MYVSEYENWEEFVLTWDLIKAKVNSEIPNSIKKILKYQNMRIRRNLH